MIELSTRINGATYEDLLSMSGHMILLVGEEGHTVPLAWESGKIQRVVKLTIAAELLSCSKGVEDAFFLNEMIGADLSIQAWVNHKGAVQSVNSTNTMVDKRLRIDTAAIQLID